MEELFEVDMLPPPFSPITVANLLKASDFIKNNATPVGI